MNKISKAIVFFLIVGVLSVIGYFAWAKNGLTATNKNSTVANTEKSECFVNDKDSEHKYNQYKKILSTLPNDKIESIQIAFNTYFKYFSLNDKQIYRDNAFKLFKDFLEKVSNNTIIEDSNDNIENKKEYYKSLGLMILGGEGGSFAVINFDFLDKQFSGYLSNPWKEYLKLNANEDKNRFEEDYQILIPWDEIRKRIINRENFINKYPTFSENTEIKKYLEGYFKCYIGGLDNSKITNYPRDNKLRLEIKISYEKFIKNNKNSQYYQSIVDYYKLLRKHDFVIGEYVNKFLKEKGLGYANY